MSATLEMVANSLPSYSATNAPKLAGPQKQEAEPQMAGPKPHVDLAPENRVDFAGADLGAASGDAQDENAPKMIDVFA